MSEISNPGLRKRVDNKQDNILFELVIIFAFVNSIGFPGNYTKAFGSSLGTLIEYTSFLLQIIVMLMSSGDSLFNIKIVNLHRKYRSIYFLLIVFTVCSMLVTISKSKELISCVRVSVTAFFGIWIVENFSLKKLLEMIYTSQIIFIFFSVVFAVFFKRYRDWTSSYASYYIGLYGTKNQAGMELAFGMNMQILLLRVYNEEKRQISQFFFGFLALQAVLLVLTQSTGAMIVTLIPAVYILHFEKKWGRDKWFQLPYLYIIASVGFIIFALTVIQWFAPVLESIGEDATLTGRVPLWNRVIEIMLQSHTLTGYGYGMFWFNERAVNLFHAGFDENTWASKMTAGAHNVLMDMWLNVGLIGIGAYFMMLLDSFKDIKRLTEEQYLFSFIYVFSFMLHGFTERAFGTYDYHTLFLFLACAIGCNRTELIEERKDMEDGTDKRKKRIFQRDSRNNNLPKRVVRDRKSN